jgi:hypothetical protein
MIQKLSVEHRNSIMDSLKNSHFFHFLSTLLGCSPQRTIVSTRTTSSERVSITKSLLDHHPQEHQEVSLSLNWRIRFKWYFRRAASMCSTVARQIMARRTMNSFSWRAVLCLPLYSKSSGMHASVPLQWCCWSWCSGWGCCIWWQNPAFLHHFRDGIYVPTLHKFCTV